MNNEIEIQNGRCNGGYSDLEEQLKELDKQGMSDDEILLREFLEEDIEKPEKSFEKLSEEQLAYDEVFDSKYVNPKSDFALKFADEIARGKEIFNTFNNSYKNLPDFRTEDEKIADDYLDHINRQKYEAMSELEASSRIMGGKLRWTRTEDEIAAMRPISREIYKKSIKNIPQGDYVKYLPSIFRWEGGYGATIKDDGDVIDGKLIGTKYGISAKTLKWFLGRTPTVQEMKSLTKEDAGRIYYKRFFKDKRVEEIPESIREIYFHVAINGEGHVNHVMRILTGNVLPSRNGSFNKKNYTMTPEIFQQVKSGDFNREQFARVLIKKYKTFKKWKDFGRGWIDRFYTLGGISKEEIKREQSMV